jgi:hypothetical protein
VINGNPWGGAMPANFLYRNNGNTNAWLRIKPIGAISNRDGVGAKVRVKATYAGQARWQRRDVSGGDSFNGNHLIAHFGLGDATNVDVLRIEWPSGIVQNLTDVPARQLLTVTEPMLPIAILPASLDVSSGAHVTLTFNTTSSVPWTCQWRLNDTDLAGETNLTLHLTNAQTNQTGTYSAFVSDGANSVTTRSAILNVFDGPMITVQPTNQMVRAGTAVTFRVTAYSPAPITYQWQFNGADVADATNATLTLSNVGLAQAGAYVAVVSDSVGFTLSVPAALSILFDPVIVRQPCSVSVVQGGSVTLSVQVTNTATLPVGYRWRRGSTTVTNFLLNDYLCFLTVSNCQATTNYEVIVTNVARTSLRSSNVLVTVLADTNHNGLPDEWEARYGVGNPDGDDDGDRLSNLQEYQAGTDPTNALSYLKVQNIALAEGRSKAVLRFLAAAGKTYTVQFRDQVTPGDWQRLADVPAADTDRVAEVIDLAAGACSQRVYRLATPLAP